MGTHLYLDCDGFFASCEESADPALHGRPVAVATTDPYNPGATLIAVNPAAKRLGVGKGENSREARKSVPELVVRIHRPELYIATHHAIARAVDTVLPGAKSESIDELSAELAASDHPETILDQIKRAIRNAVGPIIMVSCGVAPSAWLAKTAAYTTSQTRRWCGARATFPRCTKTSNSPTSQGSGPQCKGGSSYCMGSRHTLIVGTRGGQIHDEFGPTGPELDETPHERGRRDGDRN